MVKRRLASVPDIMTTSAWVASVPRPATVKAAAGAAALALEDARKVRRFVAFSFRGTIPPPPWPQHAELIKARRRMEIMRDGLIVIERRAPGGRIKPKLRKALVREGKALYRETNVLLAKLQDLPKSPADLVPALFGSIPWFVWVGVAYVVSQRKKSWF